MEACKRTEWDVSIVYEAESIHQKYFNSAHMYIYSIYGVNYRSTSQAIQKLPAQWEIISQSIFREHAHLDVSSARRWERL